MPRPKPLDWANAALEELADGLAYIAEESLSGAATVKHRFDLACARISRNPTVNREDVVAGTREAGVARTQYTLIFEERADSIVILHCWHQRRQAPASP